MESLLIGAAALSLLLLLGACRNMLLTDEGAGVTITGAVYTDVHVDLPCDELQDNFESIAGGSGLSDIGLVFRDPAGQVLGTTHTGELETEALSYGCRLAAPYRVEVPLATAYRVEFDPPEVQDLGQGYFTGTEELSPREISAEDLAAAGHEWSFEVSPSFVTP